MDLSPFLSIFIRDFDGILDSSFCHAALVFIFNKSRKLPIYGC